MASFPTDPTLFFRRSTIKPNGMCITYVDDMLQKGTLGSTEFCSTSGKSFSAMIQFGVRSALQVWKLKLTIANQLHTNKNRKMRKGVKLYTIHIAPTWVQQSRLNIAYNAATLSHVANIQHCGKSMNPIKNR